MYHSLFICSNQTYQVLRPRSNFEQADLPSIHSAWNKEIMPAICIYSYIDVSNIYIYATHYASVCLKCVHILRETNAFHVWLYRRWSLSALWKCQYCTKWCWLNYIEHICTLEANRDFAVYFFTWNRIQIEYI